MRRFTFTLVALLVVTGCASSSPSSTEDPTVSPSANTSANTAAVTATDVDVFMVERTPEQSTDLPDLLFLHGGAFTSDIWVETGILDSTAATGFRSVAIDLPGYGQTQSIDGDKGDFLRTVIADVDSGNGVVVISPSMSGGWSLDLIASDGADSMLGFVPVAPVGIADFAEATNGPIEGLPTLILWGAGDDVIPLESADVLAAVLTDSTVQIIDDAGHPAYRDQPTIFADLVIDFASSL